jgi:DNA-binding response OmpR family regulator
MRVLVVDDFQDAATITQMLLEAHGHDCRIAVTGTEALAVAEAFDPEVAILDIGLPDLSGFEIARILRGRKTKRLLYLAAVTGWGDRETREKAFRAGFDDHILKPTDGKMLQKILHDAQLALAS